MPRALSLDIFCKVVDNFGDAGICFRLARQLATEYGFRTRLWIDDPAPLAPWRDDLPNGVEIRRWPDEGESAGVADIADVIIEAFACEIPAARQEAMASRPLPPCWINLEYLSAEGWVAGCHARASPHPRLPLTKYFFFPGFTPDTGGLLREKDLPARQEAFRQMADREKWLASHGLCAGLRPDTLLVSLFCYDTAPLAALIEIWRRESAPILCLVAPGKPRQAVETALGLEESAPGKDGLLYESGALRLVVFPFLTQTAYDELLWLCDLNFVRG
ncbi:MAG: elongation factor P maturation arginine rhamnosyltransferase EarP, partial [Zoogloeaceae bacterium]|nr:elongation factor P maturation arginine rhamnosyltransferase EarP [Zoogloeaceae bacterium]